MARHEIPELRQDYQDSGIFIRKYNECSHRVDGDLSDGFPTVVGCCRAVFYHHCCSTSCWRL